MKQKQVYPQNTFPENQGRGTSLIFPSYKERMIIHFLMLMPLLFLIRISVLCSGFLISGFVGYSLAFYLEKLLPRKAHKNAFEQGRKGLAILSLVSWFVGLIGGGFLYVYTFFLST